MKILLGILGAFPFISSLTMLPAQAPIPGEGKVIPQWQSIFVSGPVATRTNHPFYLVDNNGRRAAKAYVYVPVGGRGQIVREGNRQYERGDTLRIEVTNLTQDCEVEVIWPAFLFRTDGQPEGTTLQLTAESVAAGEKLVKQYKIPQLLTIKEGRHLQNEVSPNLSLACRPSRGKTQPVTPQKYESKSAPSFVYCTASLFVSNNSYTAGGVAYYSAIFPYRMDSTTFNGGDPNSPNYDRDHSESARISRDFTDYAKATSGLFEADASFNFCYASPTQDSTEQAMAQHEHNNVGPRQLEQRAVHTEWRKQ